MKSLIKIYLIHALDMFDAYVLRHRFYSVCCKIASSDWWDKIAGECNCWYCKKARN